MGSRAYLTELFSLDGLVAVVTGGSSGIGRAVAAALARAGASTVVVARGEARLAATVDELTAHGCRAAWVGADLGTRDGVRAAAEEAPGCSGSPTSSSTAPGSICGPRWASWARTSGTPPWR